MPREIPSLPTETCGCEWGHLCAYHEGYRDALAQVADDGHFETECGCERSLVCSGCHRPETDCRCDPFFYDLEDTGPDGEDVADLDPLTRTLLGLPSGIHCHTNGCPDA